MDLAELEHLKLFVVVFGAVALIIFVLIASHDYRRRRGLAALAPELGFTYQREDTLLLNRFEGFRLFLYGRYANNVLQGESWRTTIWLFDLMTRTPDGKPYRDYTVCALRSPDLNLPHFFLSYEVPGLDRIGPLLAKGKIVTKIVPVSAVTSIESVGEALFAGLGAGDIHFPEDEKFSKKVVLQGEEKETVRALFDAEVRHHLMRFAGTLVQIEGRGDLLVLTPGYLILPKNAREIIRQAADLVTLLAQRTSPR